MKFSAKASRIPFNAVSMECSYLSHSSPGARPGVGLRCGQRMRHHCIIHTCCCPCQRSDYRVWVKMWNIKTEPAIACRCGSGCGREGKATLTRCKMSISVCDQGEHEVTSWWIIILLSSTMWMGRLPALKGMCQIIC